MKHLEEMPPDATEISAGNATEAPKSGGKMKLLTLENMDKRGAAYRRTADLIAHIERDLGGVRQLSTAQQQLVRHAALTAAMLEDLGSRWLAGQAIDPSMYATLVNAARRGFQAIGLARVPREVDTLSSYVAAKSVTPEPRP
jgi:hypothetical protein